MLKLQKSKTIIIIKFISFLLLANEIFHGETRPQWSQQLGVDCLQISYFFTLHFFLIFPSHYFLTWFASTIVLISRYWKGTKKHNIIRQRVNVQSSQYDHALYFISFITTPKILLFVMVEWIKALYLYFSNKQNQWFTVTRRQIFFSPPRLPTNVCFVGAKASACNNTRIVSRIAQNWSRKQL